MDEADQSEPFPVPESSAADDAFQGLSYKLIRWSALGIH
jgi:hypothetical protein